MRLLGERSASGVEDPADGRDANPFQVGTQQRDERPGQGTHLATSAVLELTDLTAAAVGPGSADDVVTAPVAERAPIAFSGRHVQAAGRQNQGHDREGHRLGQRVSRSR